MKKGIFIAGAILLFCVIYLIFGYITRSDQVSVDRQVYQRSDVDSFQNPIDQAYWDFHAGKEKDLSEAGRRGYEVGYSVSWQKEFFHVTRLLYEAIKTEEDRQKLVEYVKEVQLMSGKKAYFMNLDFERAIHFPDREPSFGNWNYTSLKMTECTIYRKEALDLIACYETYISAPYAYLPVEFAEEEGLGMENIPEYFRLQNESESSLYHKQFFIPESESMPALTFELTGINEPETNSYYPKKLVIKTQDRVIQEFDFNKDDFAPCNMDDFAFEYGDFRFDGYGGFRILETSMGKNPSYNFWMWDKNTNKFVECPELDMIGYITFDYSNQEVHVTSNGSGNSYELSTYKYVEGNLTLTEKIVDADSDGFRKVYRLKNGELELTEITESHLKG